MLFPAGNKLNLGTWEEELQRKQEDFWQKLGGRRALKLFHLAAARVPAYKDFLAKNKLPPSKIKTILDLNLVPQTDKANYIQKYPLAARCLDGNLKKLKIIASSSGTSGQPNYWPRSGYQESEAALTHELLFKNLFHIDKYSTLCIVGFPMGVYVSGVATLLPSWLLAKKYNLTIVSAGNNKLEVLKAVKNLSRNFEQTLLIGHPFFIKDVIESGKTQGINWSTIKLKMMFCSEGFSENWREYLLKEAGQKNSSTAFNTYGSSEMLLMAYETPMSIKIRQSMETNQALAKDLLGSTHVPNLFQYNPALRFIQEEQNELLFTSFSGLPLVRFNLHDAGKVLSYDDLQAKLTKHLPKSLEKASWKLPFVTVEGRSDYAVIFYAANIYPQHIHAALGHKSLLQKITGKFIMTKGYYKNMDEYLEIQIELKPHALSSAKFAHQIQKLIVEKLKMLNAEYIFLWHNLQKDIRPKIKLWPYGHEKYFKLGLKPRYIGERSE